MKGIVLASGSGSRLYPIYMRKNNLLILEVLNMDVI